MTTVVLVYIAFALVVWIGRGFVLYWRVKHDPRVTPGMFECCAAPAPHVTVIVPAHNEEKGLPASLDLLLAQDYPDYDVVVVDDRSTDRTAAIVEERARRDARLRLVRNDELPAGWSGRNHALHVGAKEARGEWLLFTDADVRHSPDSLAQSVTYALRNGIDMLSLGFPLCNESFWQKVIKPGVLLIIVIMHRLSKVNDPSSADVDGNGQFLLVRREAYDAIGGRAAMPGENMDKVLAKRVKDAGLKLFYAYAPGLCEASSYGKFRDIWHADMRILAGKLDRSLAPMAWVVLFLVIVDMLPYVALAGSVVSWLVSGGTPAATLAVLSVALMALVQGVTASAYRAVGAEGRYAALHFLAAGIVVAMVIAGGAKVMTRGTFQWNARRSAAG